MKMICWYFMIVYAQELFIVFIIVNPSSEGSGVRLNTARIILISENCNTNPNNGSIFVLAKRLLILSCWAFPSIKKTKIQIHASMIFINGQASATFNSHSFLLG